VELLIIEDTYSAVPTQQRVWKCVRLLDSEEIDVMLRASLFLVKDDGLLPGRPVMNVTSQFSD
jgi:hypothetical protein